MHIQNLYKGKETKFREKKTFQVCRISICVRNSDMKIMCPNKILLDYIILLHNSRKHITGGDQKRESCINLIFSQSSTIIMCYATTTITFLCNQL